MRRAICAVLLAGWLLPPQPGTPAPPVVVVHAWVENEQGQPAGGLRAEDFEIYLDGAPVTLQSVSPRDTNAAVIVLLDTSRTVPWNGRRIGEHIAEFAAALAPDDEVMVATFGGRTEFPPFRPASRDVRAEVRRAVNLRDDEGYGASRIWDNLHRAVTILAQRPAPRAVLLLTDGQATGNHYSLVEVADYAMAHRVSVNVIARPAARRILQNDPVAPSGGAATRPAVLVQPSAPLRAVTRYTGGQFFTYPERQEAVAQALFTLTASAVRGLHAFGFTGPPADRGPHRLEIRSRRAGLKVHAPLALVLR